jgi:hypothetical protein
VLTGDDTWRTAESAPTLHAQQTVSGVYAGSMYRQAVWCSLHLMVLHIAARRCFDAMFQHLQIPLNLIVTVA